MPGQHDAQPAGVQVEAIRVGEPREGMPRDHDVELQLRRRTDVEDSDLLWTLDLKAPKSRGDSFRFTIGPA